ncbi:hypothetical protein DNTS_024261 [Danionella cerebrum]|uniref:SAM domain-containing protein n=1 Tax=Danionella cerebrum TaxID=2873325 RepID=A0A553R3A6_9TELE|nr:hypothetical protein DNTS_024261 [Danionella translucida]
MEKENEQGSVASVASVSIPSNTSVSTGQTSNSSSRQQVVPQISVYGGITDRQTVQVIQHALSRQPSTAAAQYLQQMYAAQQQHLMLQTAALQQQQLNLAAVQQASIVAGRQSCSQNGTTSQQTVASQTTINLATSPAAAHLISRAQSGSSSPVCIGQQTVLLGNSSNPTLTASQAQMFLRAQMAQQTNLVQVARSLGRAVPLSPQLIFTPTASTTAVQSEAPTLQGETLRTNTQAQSLAVCSQQGALSPSMSQSQSVKQPPMVSGQLSVTSVKIAGAEAKLQGTHAKANHVETSSETVGKTDKICDLTTREINMSPSVTSVTGHPLISTAYTQIQTHQLLQHKQQIVIQQQPLLQRGYSQLPEGTNLHPHTVQAVTIQPALLPQPHQSQIPLLPKVPATSQQATIFHSTTVNQQTVTQNKQPAILNHTKAVPLHHSAVNVQIQSVQTQTEGRVNEKTGVGSAPVMTSGSGSTSPTVTGSAPQNGESKPPPQAIVKPQILTHLIEGFVIQEGAEPFPIERPSLLIENIKNQRQHQAYLDLQKPSRTLHSADMEMEDLSQKELTEQSEEPMLSCEFCGVMDFAYKFKRSKRFCSTVCAKRYPFNTAVQRAKRVSMLSPSPFHPSHEGSSQCSDLSSYEEPISPLSNSSFAAQRLSNEEKFDHNRELPLLTQHFLVSGPAQWNVEDVYEFICSLPGCQEIAEEFRSQEIDGQALMLLKEDHLMSTMNIKLGPALKIFARISMLKDL